MFKAVESHRKPSHRIVGSPLYLCIYQNVTSCIDTFLLHTAYAASSKLTLYAYYYISIIIYPLRLFSTTLFSLSLSTFHVQDQSTTCPYTWPQHLACAAFLQRKHSMCQQVVIRSTAAA